MLKDNLGKYSVFGGKFKIIDKGSEKLIIKEVVLTAVAGSFKDVVQSFILEYIKSMKEAEIPLPNLKDYFIKGKKLVFICEYKGSNIIQSTKGLEPSHLVTVNLDKTKQMLDIIRLAQKAGIFFDPHIKNFVIGENGKVYYVDFSPPYLRKYMELRLKLADESEKEIIKKNFDYFSPKEIGYHFAGDLLKIDKRYIQIMPQLYELLKEKNIIMSTYSDFLKKANLIKDIELTRDKRKISLI